jgi:hypothetical protein
MSEYRDESFPRARLPHAEADHSPSRPSINVPTGFGFPTPASTSFRAGGGNELFFTYATTMPSQQGIPPSPYNHQIHSAQPEDSALVEEAE